MGRHQPRETAGLTRAEAITWLWAAREAARLTGSHGAAGEAEMAEIDLRGGAPTAGMRALGSMLRTSARRRAAIIEPHRLRAHLMTVAAILCAVEEP